MFAITEAKLKKWKHRLCSIVAHYPSIFKIFTIQIPTHSIRIAFLFHFRVFNHHGKSSCGNEDIQKKGTSKMEQIGYCREDASTRYPVTKICLITLFYFSFRIFNKSHLLTTLTSHVSLLSPSHSSHSSHSSHPSHHSHSLRSYFATTFNPIMEIMRVPIKNIRQKSADSLKTRIPNNAVPTAPIPVQTT